jgi:hypothetical protein
LFSKETNMTLILSGSDGLSDVDGTAAAPAIRGTDTNTGIFFGTDIIGFSEGGVEAMRINASGVFTTTNDASIQGLTVGRGAGAIATNTAIGASALAANTTGAQAVAIGNGALQSNTTAGANTAIGYQAFFSTVTGNIGTAIGYQAGYGVTGLGNVCIGYSAGNGSSTLTSGTYNVLVGTAASTSGATDVNEIVIGTSGSTAGVTGKGSSTGFISPNGGAVYQGNNGATWSVTSDQRLKKNIVNNNTGLSVINQIQVRNFEYRLPEEVDVELNPTDAVSKTGVQLGVIAQELQAVLPECVKQESTGVMSVDADNLTWYLVNAIKELKAIVDTQAARITALEAA